MRALFTRVTRLVTILLAEISACNNPPSPMATAPIASGLTSGANVAAVPVDPHRPEANTTASTPVMRSRGVIVMAPPSLRPPCPSPDGHIDRCLPDLHAKSRLPVKMKNAAPSGGLWPRQWGTVREDAQSR